MLMIFPCPRHNALSNTGNVQHLEHIYMRRCPSPLAVRQSEYSTFDVVTLNKSLGYVVTSKQVSNQLVPGLHYS